MIMRLIAVSLLATAAITAHADEASYDITGIDGTPVMNHVVPVTTGE